MSWTIIVFAQVRSLILISVTEAVMAFEQVTLYWLQAFFYSGTGIISSWNLVPSQEKQQHAQKEKDLLSNSQMSKFGRFWYSLSSPRGPNWPCLIQCSSHRFILKKKKLEKNFFSETMRPTTYTFSRVGYRLRFFHYAILLSN